VLTVNVCSTREINSTGHRDLPPDCSPMPLALTGHMPTFVHEIQPELEMLLHPTAAFFAATNQE